MEVSPDLISSVTNDVMADLREWQNRPLEEIYPIIFLDEIRMKIRDEGTVKNKVVYLAIGVDLEGTS